MIIRRIEVRNFRKLAEPVVIEGLPSGLMLIAGDNEEGKSTLVDGIRTAFFVKHNISGEFAATLQPYNSNVRPEVRIEFELEGGHYRLFKAFCQRPEAELVTPSGAFTGAAAEEELSRLLRFSLPKRIRRDEQREHEGVFGMFWVEQGKSLDLEPSAAGRASIVEALQKEVGDVLGGKRAQRLITEVTRLREELLTSTGRPRGAYAVTAQATLEIEADLTGVEDQLARHARTTDELQRCRTRLDEYQRGRVLPAARERLQQAQSACNNMNHLRSVADDADTRLQAVTARRDLAVERGAQRAHLVESLAVADAALNELARSADTERARVSSSRRKLDIGEQALGEAEARLEATVQTLKHAETKDRLSTVRGELARLRLDRDAALAANNEREAALGIAAAIRIDKNSLAQLRRLHESATAARARLNSAATQIQVTVLPGAEVLLDQQPLVGEQQLTLTRTAVIDAPGCMLLSIIPGIDVGSPEAELEKANRNLSEALHRIGVTTLADAEDQFEARTAALNRADANAKLICAHASQGLESLSVQIAVLSAEVDALETVVVAGAPLETCDLPHEGVLVQQEHQEAKIAVEDVRSRLDQARAELNDAVIAETAATARRVHQQELCVEYKERLASERALISDEQVSAEVLQAMHEVKAADMVLAAAQRMLDEAKAEAVQQELRMAQAACEQIETDIAGLREKAIRLESELRTSGGLGLGERREELRSRLSTARLEAARVERHAKTLDLLLRVLLDAESAAKEQFLRPVTERVQQYLRILLPESELSFNEDISIVGLRRDGNLEPFHALSVGTREQLAVLTRLAFAELLREHGHPAAVLLDDAIVFADDERFESMLRILDKAAQKMQVIILTCRERDYRASGAPIIRLANCRVQAATQVGTA